MTFIKYMVVTGRVEFAYRAHIMVVLMYQRAS